MLRILGGFVLVIGALHLFFVVVSKHYEARGLERWNTQKAKELAAVRPPPKPPNCPNLLDLEKLRLPDNKIAEVRIFRFSKTIYYVPTTWLSLTTPTYGDVGGVERTNIRMFDPDIHAIECPGVIHQVTDGGMYMWRYAGIGFNPNATLKGANAAFANVSSFYAHKMRRTSEMRDPQYQQDGLLSSMDHLTLDAYVTIESDVSLRLRWHPADMTGFEWSRQYQKYTSGPLALTSPKPWAGVSRTKEFAALTLQARALHVWLATPPNKRSSDFFAEH